jgi:hypothetical protein
VRPSKIWVANIGIIFGGTYFSCIYRLMYSSLCGGLKKKRARCITLKDRGKVLEGFWWGNMRERNNVKDLGLDGYVVCK